jgi:hypothetical protein
MNQEMARMCEESSAPILKDMEFNSGLRSLMARFVSNELSTDEFIQGLSFQNGYDNLALCQLITLAERVKKICQ